MITKLLPVFEGKRYDNPTNPMEQIFLTRKV